MIVTSASMKKHGPYTRYNDIQAKMLTLGESRDLFFENSNTQ